MTSMGHNWYRRLFDWDGSRARLRSALDAASFEIHTNRIELYHAHRELSRLQTEREVMRGYFDRLRKLADEMVFPSSEAEMMERLRDQEFAKQLDDLRASGPDAMRNVFGA